MPEFEDILQSSLNYVAPTSALGPNLKTIDPTKYYSQLGPGVRGNLEYLNETRADAQNFWESSANFWVRGIGKAILSIPETAGYIMDIPGWIEQNDDFQNSLSEWARQQKEALDESMPEYSRDTHQNENFNPLSGGWWARNGDSAVESLGYFIPGWALGKAVGAWLKATGTAMKIAQGVNKAANIGRDISTVYTTANKVANAGSLLTATLASNHAEGMQIAVDAYKNTYNNLIKEGMSETQAKSIASDTAARVSRLNYAMLATDMFQMKTLFKGFDSMRRGVAFNKSALLSGALAIGKQGATESFEELYQGAMQREQERRGMKEAGLLEEDGSNVLSRAFDYMTSDQGLTEGFLGFVGGVGFGGVGVATNYKATARDRALGLEQIKLNKDLQSNLLKKQGKVFDDIAASVEEGNEAKYDNAINSMFRNMAYNSAERGVFHNIEEFVDGIDNITEEDLVKNGWSKEEAQKRKADFKEILNQTERIYKQVQNLAPNKSSALRTKLANLLLSQETSKDGIAKAQEQLRTLFAEYKGPEKSDTFNQLYELQRRKEILRLTKDEDLEGGQKQKDFYNAEYEKVSEKLKQTIADFKEMGVEFDKSYTENLSLELPVDYTLAFEYDQTFKYKEQKEEFNSLSKEKNQKAWEETQARLEKEEQYNTNLAEKITNKTKLTEEEQEHYDKNKNQIDVIAEDLEKIKKDKELAEQKAKQDNDAKIKAAKLQKVTEEKYTALAAKLGSAVETTSLGTIIPYGEHKISIQVNDDGTTTYTLKTKKGSTTYDNEEALIAMSNQLQGIEIKEKEGSKDGTGKTNLVPLTEAGIQSLKVGDEIVILTKGETRENFNQNPLFYERTKDGFVFKSLQKKDGTLISTGFPADVQSKIDNRLSDLNILMLDTDIYDVYLIENVKTEPIASAPEVFKGHITVSVVPDDDVKINPEFSEGVRSVMRILKENTLIEKPESEPNQYDWEYSFTDQRNDDTLTLIEDTTYTVTNATILDKPIILFSQKRKDEKGLHYSGRIQHIPTLSYKDLTNPITGKIESTLDFNVSAPEGTYKREVWYSLKNKNLEKLYEKLAEHKAAGKYQEVLEIYEKAINFVKTEINKTLAIREAFENGIKVKATQTPGYVLIGDLQPGSTLESNVGAFGMNIPHVLGVTKDTNTIFYKRDADGDHNANELDSLNGTIAEFTGQVNQVFLLSAESSTGYVPLRLFKNKITNLSEAKAKEVSDKILVLAYEYRDGFSNLDTKKKIQSEISKLFLTANSAEKNPHANIILDSSYIAIVFTSEGKLHQHKFWLKDIDAVTGKQVNINSFERVNYEHIIDGKTQGAATQILAGDINTNFQAALSNIFFNIDLNNLNKEGDYSPLVDLEEGEVLSYNDYVLKHLVSHNIDYLKDEKGSPKLINGKKRYFGNSAFRVELKDALKQPSQIEATTEDKKADIERRRKEELDRETPVKNENITVDFGGGVSVKYQVITYKDGSVKISTVSERPKRYNRLSDEAFKDYAKIDFASDAKGITKTEVVKDDYTDKQSQEIKAAKEKTINAKYDAELATLKSKTATDIEAKKADIEKEVLGSFANTIQRIVNSKGSSNGKTIRTELTSKISSDGEVIVFKSKNTFADDGRSVISSPASMTIEEFKEHFYPMLTADEIEMFEETLEVYKKDGWNGRIFFKELRVGSSKATNLKGQLNLDIMIGMGNDYGFTLTKKLTDTELDTLENKQSEPTQSEIEAKKADIERRRQEELNNSITDKDKVIFGHPTIGKSFLKKQGEDKFITLDDDYANEVNAFVDANRGSETRQEYKGRKPKEYNEFMLNLYDRLKAHAQKEGKILFVSNTNILKERMSDFDKVITIPKEEFKRRFDERGATYGFEDWKSDIDATVSKVNKSKVISTTGYLANLFQDKINAKYDAELAALEDKEETPEQQKDINVPLETSIPVEPLAIPTQDSIPLRKKLTEEDIDFISNITLTNAQVKAINAAIGVDSKEARIDYILDEYEKIINGGVNSVVEKILKPYKKNLTTQNSVSTLSDTPYQKIQKEKVKQWFAIKLPNINLNFVDGLIDNGIGISFGQFHRNMVTLSLEAPVGTEYHEAFHGVMRNYLSDKHQARIYSEARTKYGIPSSKEVKNFLAQNEGFESFTKEEIENFILEEKMAEDFKEFMFGYKETKQPNIIQRFFNAIKDFINHILGQPSYIARLQNNIAGGRFNKPVRVSTVKQNAITDRIPNPHFSISDEFKVINTLSGMASGLMLKSIQSWNKKQIEQELFTLITEKVDKADEYSLAWGKVQESLRAVDEYEGLYSKMWKDLARRYDIIEETQEGEYIKAWDKSMLSFNPKNTVSDVVKLEFLNIEKGINPVLGSPMYMDLQEIMPTLFRALADKPTMKAKVEALLELASVVDSEKSYPITNLVDKMRRLDYLKIRFFQAFNKYTFPQMTSTFTEEEDGWGFVNSVSVSEGFIDETIERWRNNFKEENLKERGEKLQIKIGEWRKSVRNLKEADKISEVMTPLYEILGELGVDTDKLAAAFGSYLKNISKAKGNTTIERLNYLLTADEKSNPNSIYAILNAPSSGILTYMAKDLNPYDSDLRGRWRVLSKLIGKFYFEKYDNIVETMDGEKQYVINTPNKLAIFVNEIKSEEGERMMDEFSYLEFSNWLQDWRPNGKVNYNNLDKFEFAWVRGIQAGYNGVGFAQTTDRLKDIEKLAWFLDSFDKRDKTRWWAELPYEADKTHHFIAKVPYYDAKSADFVNTLGFKAFVNTIKQEVWWVENIKSKLAPFIVDGIIDTTLMTEKQKKDLLLDPIVTTTKNGKVILGTGFKFAFMPNLNSEEKITDAVIEREAKEWIKEQTKIQIDELIKHGVFTRENDVLESSIFGKKFLREYNSFEDLIRDFVINSTIVLRESSYFVGGFDQEYKDALDKAKRAVSLGTPNNTQFGNEDYAIIVVKDIELDSLIDKKFLKGINTADGGGWGTFKRFKQIQRLGGQEALKFEHIEALERIEKGTTLPYEDIKGIGPLKPVYTGKIYNPTLGIHTDLFIKYAMFPLFKDWTSNTQLQQFTEWVEAMEEKLGVPVEILPESAVKSGKFNVVSIHDENGNFVAPDITEDSFKLIPNKNWGIQMSTPEHELDYEQKRAVQISKIILGNIVPENMYGEQTGAEIIDELSSLFADNLNEAMQTLLDEITENGVINDEKLSVWIKAQLDARGKSLNEISLLDTENGEFLLPLQNNISQKAILPFIISMFNQVREQTIPGQPYYQMSDAFLRPLADDVQIVKTAEGINWLGNKPRELGYRIEGDKIIVDCVISPWSKMLVGRDINAIHALNPDVLKIIGYRIPYGDKNFSVELNVVGFINKSIGDNISVAKELIAIMGFDFDIDKLYVMTRKFYEDENGIHAYTEGVNGRNNRIIDIMSTIINSPHHRDEVLNSGEFKHKEDLAKEFGKPLGDINLNTSVGQQTLNTLNLVAVALKGMAANFNGLVPYLQRLNLQFSTPLLVEEDGVEVEYREVGKLEGNFKGKNGRLITRATGEDVNASMDLAKKPTINTYGVNLTTMPISNVLTIQGFEDFVPLLLTQPIIELLRQTDEQYDELFSKAPAYFKLTEATLSNFALRLWHQGKKGDYRYLINVLHTLAQEQGEVGLVARIERYKDRSTADDKHVFSNYGINEADFKEFANKEIPTFSSQAEAKVWIKDNIKFVIVQLEALNIYHTLNTKAQAISKVSQALSSDRKSPDSMYSVYAMIEARQDLLDEDDKGVITSPIYSFVNGEQYPGIESVFETDVLKDARAYYELDIKMLELLATPSKFFLYSPQYYDAYKLFKQELGLGYLSREADESMYNQYVSYVLAYINSQNPKYKDLNAGEFLTEEFTDFFKQEAAWAVTKGFDVFANFKVEDSKIQQAYNAEVPFISFNSELVDDTLIDVYSAQLKDAMNLTLENYNLTEEEETRINDLVEELFKYQFITTAFITTKSAASKILPFEFFVQNVNGVPSTLRQYAKMSAEDIVNEEFTRKYVQHNYRNSNLARNVTSILPKELGTKFAGTSINAEGTIIISSNKKIHSKKKDSKRFITRTEVFKIEDREFKRYKLYERVGTTDNGSVWIQIDTLGIPYKVLEMNRTTSIIGENKAPDRDTLIAEAEKMPTFRHLHDNSVVIVEPDITPDVALTDNSFTYKDNTIGTDFAFSEEQSNALKTLIDFIGDKTSAITLAGAAGTGKTSIIGYLQKYLGSMYSFAYMAPTHAATAELAFATVKTGNNTLPATLASSLTFNSLKEKWVFTAKIAKRLSLNPVVVVDESSMIDQSDIDHLLEAIKDVGGKLIFLGDEKQISKVVKNTATKAISPAFSQFKQVTLTKIFRQSENSLLNLLAKIREQNDFKPFKVENTKAVKFLDRKEYNDELIKDLKSSPESTVVISYTNAAVQGINTTARRILGREGETVKGDIIVGYLGYASKQIEKGNLANSIAYTITNIDEDGSRRIITAQSSKLAKLIQTGIKNISDSAVFYYYQLSNDDSLTFDSLSAQDYENNNKDISALFKAMHEANEDFKAKKMSYPSYLGFVAGFSQTLASYSVGNDYVYNPTTDKMEKFDAIKHKNIKTSGQGSLLFSKDVDYGHAITIHKSQGATIDNVYFDSASLKSAQNTPIINKDGVQITTEKQSLLYVAMSRSKNKLVVYEGDVEFEMIENNDIYSKLGNKTKSENVVIKSWGELKNATAAIIPTGIIATRIPNTEEHFGNPFSHDPAGKSQGLIKTETIKEAVERYIDWILNGDFRDTKPVGTINVYWGQPESETSTRILSNLAPRKFSYASTDGIVREYGSVEHAYQSNKNGRFDKNTYDAYLSKGGYGVKISPKLTDVGKRANLQIMKDLVVESFIQNSDSEAANKLLQYQNFTHNTNEAIDKAFLEGLKLAQQALLKSKNQELQPERRDWILQKLKSGELKGKRIFYYKELGEPSHATALDYLINKYDWNQDNQWSTYADRIQAKDDKMNEEMWNKLSAEEKQEIIRCLK